MTADGLRVAFSARGYAGVPSEQEYELFRSSPGKSFTATATAAALEQEGSTETVFRILLHLGANRAHGIRMERQEPLWESLFRADA